MKLDLEKEGLDCLFHPYEAAILKRIWDKPAYAGKGIGSRELWEWFDAYALQHGLENKSRATIGNALERLKALGILEYYTITGVGGSRRLYYPLLSPQQFALMITEKVSSIFVGPWWPP